MGANTDDTAGNTIFSWMQTKAVEAYHDARQTASTGLKILGVASLVAGGYMIRGALVPGPQSAQLGVGGAIAVGVGVGAIAAGNALDETPAKPTRSDNLNQALAADDPAKSGNQPGASNTNSSQGASTEKRVVETTAAGDSFRFANAP